MLKQKQSGGDDTGKDQKSKVADDPNLKSASDKAKNVLAELDKAVKRKKGHYVECCGIRRWVED